MAALLHNLRALLHHIPHALGKRRNRPFVLGAVAVLVVAVGAAVYVFRSAPPPPRISLRLVHPPWDCARTTALLLQAVFEMRTDQEIRVTEASPEEMWMQVATDGADCGVAAWLPETHRAPRKRFGSEVEILAPFLEGARIGLAVMDGRKNTDAGIDAGTDADTDTDTDADASADTDADADAKTNTDAVRSIPDLRGREAFFRGRIAGLDPASRQMRLTREAMEAYGLGGYVLREGTVRTVKETLGEAQADGTAAVVSIWSPHWLFGRHALRWLEDPLEIFGMPESIHLIVHPDVRGKAPGAYAVLRRVRLSPGELGSAMESIRTAPHPELAARQWVRDHAALVESWLAAEE